MPEKLQLGETSALRYRYNPNNMDRNREGIEWITRLDIFREDFSERLPFEEWALNTMMQDGKPVAQMIGM